MGKKFKVDTEKSMVDLPLPILAPVSFDAWWVATQHKYKFQPYMKEVLFKQFKARGFLKTGAFDDGLSDFGIII